MHAGSKTTRMFGTIVLGAMLGLGLAGCDDAVSPEQTALTVQLTDAPGDLAGAWISVESVELAREEDGQDDAGTFQLETETGDGLVKLEDTAVTDLVRGAPIDPGTYGQIRLVIDGGVVQTTSDELFTFGEFGSLPSEIADLPVVGDFQCPSCEQSGVKVNVPEGGLQIDQETSIVMLDFNVGESFGRVAGQSGMFVMRPTITSSVVTLSGNIAGNVAFEPASDGDIPATCGGQDVTVETFTPRAVQVGSDPEVSQTAGVTADEGSTTEGSYTIEFLSPDTYRMESETVTYSDGSELTFDFSVDTGDGDAEVTVEQQSTASADYTVTGATCTAGSS